MNKILPLIAVVGLSSVAGAAVLNVASTGDDSADGSATKPFKTVTRAVKALRDLRAARPAEPVTVAIGAGFYELSETVTLTADDTTAPVTFVGAGRDKTILSGGRRLSGWRTGVDGRSWTVTLPEVTNGTWRIEQLYVNGRRVLRPTLPRNSYFVAAGKAPGCTNALPDRFTAAAGDIDAAWPDLKDGIELVLMHSWNISRLRISSYDPETRGVVLADARAGCMREIRADTPYRLENVKAAYGEVPGEWYLDRATGLLSYFPQKDEDARTTEVVAPRLATLFALKGKPGAPVKGVTFRALTFAHQAELLVPRGTTYHQVSTEAGGAIRCDYAEDVLLAKCGVSQTGGWAVKFAEGCARCAAEDCRLFDLGAGGVQIGVTDGRAQKRGAAAWTHGCRVENCLISGYGRIQPGATGVGIVYAGDNLVRRNTIRDGYYTGVNSGYGWSYGSPAAGGNVIEGNHIYEIGQRVLSDMAGIYTLGVQPGTVLRGNLIHDLTQGRYGSHGLYFDNSSSYITVSNNVIMRCTEGGVKIGGLTKHLTVANNIFLFGREFMFWPCADKEKAENIRVERNIFQWDETCGKVFGWAPSTNRISFASNVWWQAAWPEKIWFRKPGGTNVFDLVDEPSPPARWPTWRKLKKPSADVAAWFASAPGDTIEDPRLYAPYAGREHLRPMPDSPAVARGFVPFDLKGAVGCSAEESGPYAERAVRTFPELPLRARELKPLAERRAKRELRMTVFDQRYLLGGAGFAVAFETPDGKVFLFDTGNGTADPVVWSCGRDVIAPWLRANGHRTIDGVVISHGHSDHFGGLFDLWYRYPVARYWDNQYYMPGLPPHEHGGEPSCADDLRTALAKANPRMIYETVRQGATLDWGKDLKVTIITPPAAGIPYFENEKRMKGDTPWHNLINANALGLRVEYGETVFQIMGDIQADYEAKFLLPTLPPEWRKVDVLLPCSHGIHATREEAEFFRPKIAVGCCYEDGAPAGWSRTWANSLPIRHYYPAVGAEFYISGIDGNVTVISDGKKCRAETEFGRENRRENRYRRGK